MEVEAKFHVPDEDTLVALETAPALAGYDVDPGERRHDRDTFLDTPGRDFLARGCYLRRRETGDGIRLTLKQLLSDAGGVLRRDELEMLVVVDVPVNEWPEGVLRSRVEEIAAGQPLEPLLTLSQERLARRVRRDGREVAELSLDRVLVQGADGEHLWFEAEVETRGEDADDDLEALARDLRESWGLVPETRAKFARALEARDGDGAADGGAAGAGEG